MRARKTYVLRATTHSTITYSLSSLTLSPPPLSQSSSGANCHRSHATNWPRAILNSKRNGGRFIRIVPKQQLLINTTSQLDPIKIHLNSLCGCDNRKWSMMNSWTKRADYPHTYCISRIVYIQNFQIYLNDRRLGIATIGLKSSIPRQKLTSFGSFDRTRHFLYHNISKNGWYKLNNNAEKKRFVVGGICRRRETKKIKEAIINYITPSEEGREGYRRGEAASEKRS